MSVSQSLYDRIAALEAGQTDHATQLQSMQPILDSASGTVNDLARQIQLEAATPQPSLAAAIAAQKVTQNITNVNGVLPVELAAPQVVTTILKTVAWTTYTITGVPRTAQAVVVEAFGVGKGLGAGAAFASIITRVNSAAPGAQIQTLAQVNTDITNGSPFANQAIVFIDTAAFAFDYEILETHSVAGVDVFDSLTFQLVGYFG